MKYLLVLTLCLLTCVGGYILGSSQTQNNNNTLAIAVRMAYTQQCSENFEHYFNQSSNSMRMSKEQMMTNNICYLLGDQISFQILKNEYPISEENVVDVIDKAMGSIKIKETATQEDNQNPPNEII